MIQKKQKPSVVAKKSWCFFPGSLLQVVIHLWPAKPLA
jgi:hypothetical protein